MRALPAALLAALCAAASACGPECTSVVPSVELKVLGRLDAGAGDAGIRALRLAHGDATGATYAIVAGSGVVARVFLPAKHCEGELALRVAQVVGPSEPAIDQTLAVFAGAAETGTPLATDTTLSKADDSLPREAFKELDARRGRLGPSTTVHAITFRVPEGVDEVTVLRTSSEIRESAISAGSFTTAPKVR